MGMLEGQVQFVIGSTPTATATELLHLTVASTTVGHRPLLGWVQRQAPGSRVWAIEARAASVPG